MRTWLLLLAAISLLVVAFGCGGGGGGGGSATLTGRVLNVVTGGPPNPASSVQVGQTSVFTNAADGSFNLTVPKGTTGLLIDTLGLGFGAFTYTFAGANGVTDVGDLWIGPEKVSVQGTIRNASNSNPISGAQVSFAGRNAVTDASGNFILTNVAYSSATQTAFWGILGTAKATGFLKTDWSTQPHTASSGIVDVGDILMTPLSDPNPPPAPYNIWGIVSAPGGAPGSIIRLKLSGVDVRVFNVGADGKYYFFVNPGTYTVVGEKGASTSSPQIVTLTAPNQVIQANVSIP
ncbi:MAG: hypothetical protein KF784_12340 [Fimbriimonadaceae bacterium]|nr:hypothetical protein [Fimbriimonadaceae bacterium]